MYKISVARNNFRQMIAAIDVRFKYLDDDVSNCIFAKTYVIRYVFRSI